MTTLSRRSALQTILAGLPVGWAGSVYASDAPERKSMRFGMIALTDCASIVMAHELGLFKKYGIDLKKHALKYMEMTGVDDVADGSPADLSLGTQQRIAIARAMSLEPRFLLLDEPFGMLDTLTRFELQDTLLAAWEKSRKTVVMVTHDIDEALYLADRIVLMTDGPESCVGEIIGVPFERPRDRALILKRPDYHTLRNRVLDFLENHANHGKKQ